jgi:hypothetical protein
MEYDSFGVVGYHFIKLSFMSINIFYLKIHIPFFTCFCPPSGPPLGKYNTNRVFIQTCKELVPGLKL